MLNVVVLVSGGGTNLQAIIDAINTGSIKNAKIVKVISSNDEAFALKRAEAAGIPNVSVNKKACKDNKEFEQKIIDEIEKSNGQLIVLAGFLSVLSKDFCKRYENKIINVHPSLIPAFCGDGCYGIKVHEMVLAYGVKVTGATVHYVNEVTDGGKIILQKAIEISGNETPQELQSRVMKECEWEILPKAINIIANS